MAKYKNLKELAEAFKAGKLEGWILVVDNDSTHLSWIGPLPDGVENDSDESEEFEDQKYEEGRTLYDGYKDIYILDQVLALAGIPNRGA